MSFLVPVVLALALGPAQAPAAQPPAPAATTPAAPAEAEECLTCHGDAGLTLDLPSGEHRSLHVDVKAFGGSVHEGLGCKDCHAEMTELPHPTKAVKNARELTIAVQEACRRCHFDNYTKTLDSVHSAMIAKGDLRAPVCVDCHGSHDVTRPGEPRARISRTCARCHGKVSAEYVKSVHGTALLEQANPDVAVCTDCHRAHDITDPRTPAVLLTTPQLCGKCHSDEKLMKKYGLSTDVVRTYLSDFHGMNATMQRAGGARPQVTALCIDCHGVHDIMRVKDPNSPVMKANLLTLCRKCHPSAVANFPAAWLSHYEPSWKRTPLVYSAKVFYAVLIPFMISGLVLQILLHLWRVVVNR